jgi:hypothetical protein
MRYKRTTFFSLLRGFRAKVLLFLQISKFIGKKQAGICQFRSVYFLNWTESEAMINPRRVR